MNHPISRSAFFIYSTCFPVLFLFFTIPSAAQGNLLVTPKRVVFEGSKRSEELNLANIGKDSATYFISFIQIRMNEEGGFETITEPDSMQRFADKFLRFFPRSVTLAPNEAQSVKMQLTKTGQLLPGEYRSHIYFRAVPARQPLGEKTIATDSSISIKMVPVFGITMPVIIKVGDSDAAVNFSDISFMEKDTIPFVKMTFNRTGNMSVYGDVAIDYISADGIIIRVATVNGLAVYTPTEKRHFQMELDSTHGINYHSGKLHLVYSEQSIRGKQLAVAELELH